MSLCIMYLIGFGPACWLGEAVPATARFVFVIYYPVIKVSWDNMDNVAGQAMRQYSELVGCDGCVAFWVVRMESLSIRERERGRP
jgi:hypothetical protein